MNLSGLKFLLAQDAAAQTAPSAPNPKAQMLNFVLLMGGMVLMMWLLIFRPNQKRAKDLATMLKSLRAGDKIVTSSGIVGVVLSIRDKDNTISIRSSETKLEILKSAVAEVRRDGGEPSAS
jgi:preprotein translocase subunit YajC